METSFQTGQRAGGQLISIPQTSLLNPEIPCGLGLDFSVNVADSIIRLILII